MDYQDNPPSAHWCSRVCCLRSHKKDMQSVSPRNTCREPGGLAALTPATVDYLRPHHETGTLIVFMVLFYFFVTMMSAAYIRTLLKIIFDPGVVPLGPMAAEMPTEMQPRKRRQEPGELEAQPYIEGPDPDPDSPGLEQFYSKDVFVCENDGRPRWCSTCRTWKPDRAHHSNEIGRCVRKMDHYCPWVGGIISETC